MIIVGTTSVAGTALIPVGRQILRIKTYDCCAWYKKKVFFEMKYAANLLQLISVCFPNIFIYL